MSQRTIRAAQYVRMSTDHQRYSTENQADALERYADKHGMRIVRTYEDSGKSGLNVEGRLALTQLIDDVITKRADFEVLLVYDVCSGVEEGPPNGVIGAEEGPLIPMV